MSYDQKKDAIAKIYDSLDAGCAFVWADLIRYNPLKQAALLAYRHLRAVRKGASPVFALNNLRKETKEDAKLSIDETLELGREVGFRHPRVIGEFPLSTAAVFLMEK